MQISAVELHPRRRDIAVLDKSRASGFTLLELVATLVIVGVLAATAAPTFFNSQPFEERGYADELASTLRYARRVAVASQCRVAVTINPGGYAVNQHATLGYCETGTTWTTPVRRADGRPLVGAPPADVAVAPAVLVVFEVGGNIVGAPPPVAVGSFTLVIDANSGSTKVQP